MQATSTDRRRRRHALRIHGACAAFGTGLAVIAWAATGGAYFWPMWVAFGLGLTVVVHAAYLEAADLPANELRPLLIEVGAGTIVFTLTVVIWAMTGFSSFWPAWVLIGLMALIGGHALYVFRDQLAPGGEQSRLTERIEALTRTRAGAADAQADELRRIERNLHDGAQAWLVSVSMSLGMARERVNDDPARARELIDEAQTSAMRANSELRTLVRGIAPPLLADRGLEAAVNALPTGTGLATAIDIDLDGRLPSAVELAAYFVVSESLTNAAKHAGAKHAGVLVSRNNGAVLVKVTDDGAGGADPDGTGLDGLRRRVEALDGTFAVESPEGGPTTIRAEMPCAS